MQSYLLLIGTAILLAVQFLVQKLYQSKAGSGMEASLLFNILLGLTMAVIFWAVSGFRLQLSLFSVGMAFCMAFFVVCYMILGFRVMEQGQVALYTLFLMTGGMTVPYVWGLIWLGEPLTVFGLLGLLCILFSVVLSNLGSGRIPGRVLALCVGVFLLNGCTSVISKSHQISPLRTVDSNGFVCLVGLAKAALSGLALAVLKLRGRAPRPVRPLFRYYPIILLGAVVTGVALLLQLVAAEGVRASVLYPFTTGGSIVLSGLGSVLFFREKQGLIRWCGMGICFLGTCLFVFS